MCCAGPHTNPHPPPGRCPRRIADSKGTPSLGVIGGSIFLLASNRAAPQEIVRRASLDSKGTPSLGGSSHPGAFFQPRTSHRRVLFMKGNGPKMGSCCPGKFWVKMSIFYFRVLILVRAVENSSWGTSSGGGGGSAAFFQPPRIFHPLSQNPPGVVKRRTVQVAKAPLQLHRTHNRTAQHRYGCGAATRLAAEMWASAGVGAVLAAAVPGEPCGAKPCHGCPSSPTRYLKVCVERNEYSS